ncbi:pirin family protein [Psychroflexus maritimus]|uniref:Pirin family protein n=1 Tax=Psychroflexus maritimus TaxID=2714865 RepID=A0A967E0G7_9FLAO|nr:pirin family protein [Psychroflexus maritimus]NGZ90622.1 pirin family protein [Psychroflexus maritimus]
MIKYPAAINHISELGFHWETQDPFLFCAFHQDHYPPGNQNLGPNEALLAGRISGNDFNKKEGFRMYHGQQVPGFPGHPHAGFETITLVEKGYVDHSDSLGAKGRFGYGDVQWMTAGKGILHSEMFPLVNQKEDNPLLLFQIWLNLPRASKEVKPHFKMYWNELIPREEIMSSNGKKTSIKIIAGQLCQTKALAPTPDSFASKEENQVNIWRISMEEGAEFQFPESSLASHRNLYFFEGNKIEINGKEISNGHQIELDAQEKTKLVCTAEAAEFLFLEAKPINEPVVQRGPFVASSPEAMNEVIRHYQETEFGGWPFATYEQVHPVAARRFAQHSGGKIEHPPTPLT